MRTYTMSIFSNFTKRNNLIKTLQFKLTPMYGTVEQMEKLCVLDKDRERGSCWKSVLVVLRRVDAAFMSKALTDGVNLDWQPLSEALAAGERGNIVRQQAEMRKAVAKLMTKHSDYKSIVNPTKAIKMAATEAQNDTEAQAVGRYARFTTVLVDYFNLKKSYFTHEERRTTIAYRIVYGNFPLYLENLSLLKQYAEAGLNFQDRFPFLIFEVNSYNQCLIQSQIEVYNRAVGQINMDMQKLYAQHKLLQSLKSTPIKLKPLQRQVLSGGLGTRPAAFATYAKMQDTVCELKAVYSV